jgi:hypothetical protein
MGLQKMAIKMDTSTLATAVVQRKRVVRPSEEKGISWKGKKGEK